MSITVPTGTRIYLSKNTCNQSYAIWIKPDNTLLNDDLFVSYDVKVGAVTAIRKGTRVRGNWVTESLPIVAAQFQAQKIYPDVNGLDFFADSTPIQKVTLVNPVEVGGATVVFKEGEFRSPSNVPKRIVQVRNKTIILEDNLSNVDIAAATYLDIRTQEIPVTLTSPLIVPII